MPSSTVRISCQAHKLLGELAEQSGESMQAVLDKALESYRRQCFLEGLAADFAALRASPKAWDEELAEREFWDQTLMDDLEDEPKREARPVRARSPRKQRKR